ncbi:MAG TPA: PKD-like domain-containing protein, partial [Fibrella sp.]
MTFLISVFGTHTATASHFRGGTLKCEQAGGNSIKFTMTVTWRRGYSAWSPLNPPVGTTLNTGAFYFGDGTSTTVNATVNSSDATADIINTTWVYTKTYASTGTYVVNGLLSGARLSTITGQGTAGTNADAEYNLQAVVKVGAPFNNSPVSSFPAIANVPINSASVSFSIPSTDPDGDNISFRLSKTLNPLNITTDQTRESGLVVQSPPGFSLASNGTVTMNTVGRAVGETYAVQVMMEDRDPVTNALKSKAPVDFLVRMVAASAQPVFVSPTPLTPNNSFSVLPGNNLTFTVAANDPDAGQSVTLNPVSVPVGSTMTPSLPVTGPVNGTVSSTFSWTPTTAQVGNYVISFVAADNLGVQKITTININVPCALNATVSVTNNPCFGQSLGAVDVTPSNFSSAGNLTYNWTGPNGFTASTQDISNRPAGNYSLRIDDVGTGCFKIFPVTIGQPAALSASVSSNTPPSCNGATDGSATVSATGGSGNYTYAWSPSGGTAATATGLGAGTYSVTVADADAPTCQTVVNNIVITEPAMPTVSLAGATSICAGSSTDLTFTGTANATVTYTAAGANPQIIGLGTGGLATVNVSPGSTTLYTITEVAIGTCSYPVANGPSATVTIKPIPDAVATPSSQTSCNGEAIDDIAFSSAVSNTTYTWTGDMTTSVTGISTPSSGNITGSLTNSTNAPVTVTFTVTPSSAGCTGTAATATVTVNPTPDVAQPTNQVVCNGEPVAVPFSGATANTTYSWTSSGASIGLAATGTGNIGSFMATNATNAPVTATVTVTPSIGGGSQNLIVNGGFETGTLSGWTATPTSGTAGWKINNGTFAPSSGIGTSPPISGGFDVVTDQTGPALNLLSSGVMLPGVLTSATLSWKDRIRNSGGAYANPQQQFRVELLNSSMAVISTVFTTNPGDPLIQNGPNNRSFNVTSILTAYAGQQIYVRFAEQDQYGYFNVTLDDISLDVNSACPGPTKTFTITVNPTPTASISGSTAQPICSGTSTPITFSGTPDATVSYTKTGTPGTQTITLDGNGSAVITTTYTTNTTYTLTGVVATTGCSAAASGQAVVTVKASPTVSVTINPPSGSASVGNNPMNPTN